MKAGSSICRPLPSSIVEALPVFADSRWLLTLDGKHPFSNFGYAKAELDRRILAARKKAHGADAKPMPAWRLHDLRRSVATGMQRLGVRLEAVEAVLGHVSGTPGRHRRRLPAAQLREGGRRGAGAVGRPRDAAARSDAGQGGADAEGGAVTQRHRLPARLVINPPPPPFRKEPAALADLTMEYGLDEAASCKRSLKISSFVGLLNWPKCALLPATQFRPSLHAQGQHSPHGGRSRTVSAIVYLQA